MKVLPLDEFIAQFPPTYPHDNPVWEATVEYMLNDPLEKITLDGLIEDFKRDGRYRNPVYVGTRTNFDETESPAVCNGTHRVVAAIISEAPYIQYTWEDDPEWSYSEDNPIRATILTQEVEDEGLADFLFYGVRSLRISGSEWVTADYSFGSIGKCELFYEGILATPENLQRVKSKIEEVLNGSPYAYAIISVETDEYSYEDDTDED